MITQYFIQNEYNDIEFINASNKLKDYLDKIDLVLIMSVEPGFGGQKFIKNTFNKIKELKELREKNKNNFLIEIDGGVNIETQKILLILV